MNMTLKRDSLSNLLGSVVPLLVAIVAIPFLLNRMGAERFGVLTLMWALIGYFGIFDFGLGRALTYAVSQGREQKDETFLRDRIHSGLLVTLLTGGAGAIVVAFITIALGKWGGVFGLSIDAEVIRAFLIISLAVVPATVTSGLRGVLEGFGRFPASNANRLTFGVLMFALPMAAVYWRGVDIVTISKYLVLGRFGVMLMAAWLLRRSLVSAFKGGLRMSRSHAFALGGYGGWVSMSNVISPMMVYGDRFLVSAIVGAQLLPFYSIPQEGIQRLIILPTALSNALFPRLVAHKGDDGAAIQYRRYFMRVALAMGLLCILAAMLAGPVLSLWISPDFAEKTKWIVMVLCVGVWFNSMAQLPFTLLHAVGAPKLTALFHAVEFAIYIGLVIVLCLKFGILGAAIAWSLRVILDFILLHTASQSKSYALSN